MTSLLERIGKENLINQIKLVFSSAPKDTEKPGVIHNSKNNNASYMKDSECFSGNYNYNHNGITH